MTYLRIIDCLHPMVSPGNLVFRLLRVGRGKDRSTGEKHGTVRICPTVPPSSKEKWTFAKVKCVLDST